MPMNRTIKWVPSSMCTCNIEDHTTEHILQICPKYIIRNQLWPDNTTLQQKRYVTLEELRRTVTSIQQYGLPVQSSEQEEEDIEEINCIIDSFATL